MKEYVLIQTDLRREPLASTLLAIPGIIAADDLQGPYGAIALADSGPKVQHNEAILASIRKLPGVTRAVPVPLSATLSPAPGGMEPGRDGEAA